MKPNSCKICGGTDMNLVAGFYYCVECGTQDENVQESVVEDLFLADGSLAVVTKKKIYIQKETVEMNEEWYKWHAYNFIIAGLTDELIAAGAKPSVRKKVLWIWTRYIKKFQMKNTGPVSAFCNEDKNGPSLPVDLKCQSDHNKDNLSQQAKEIQKDIYSNLENDKAQLQSQDKIRYRSDEELERESDEDSDYILNSDDDSDSDNDSLPYDASENLKLEREMKSLRNMTKGVIIAIFYAALNLDRSEIQLSHLNRLITFGYVKIRECVNYIPKDLNVTKIPRFLNFRKTLTDNYSITQICKKIIALFKVLDLGLPLIPNIRNIIDQFMVELCLPNDFKNLVESLIFHYPSEYFKLSQKLSETSFFPDYETICMAYVVIAFKMCFGLDSDYEMKLSKSVSTINVDNSYPKSYKLGAFSDSTSRLFSFIEWCEYVTVRKLIISKNNFLMANLWRHTNIDDYVFIEHSDNPSKSSLTLGQELALGVLNKIPLENKVAVIPSTEFDLTVNPITSATSIILDYIQDPDLRLKLSEDFTQYSLDYAISLLNLKENNKESNTLKGVSELGKVENMKEHEHARTLYYNRDLETSNMVYVRFIEDKDLCKDVLGDKQNLSKIEINDSKNTSLENKNDINDNMDMDNATDSSKTVFTNKKTIKFIDYPNVCIYDDDNKDEVKEIIKDVHVPTSDNSFTSNEIFPTSLISNATEPYHQELPKDFDKKAIIDDLIKIACKKTNTRLPNKASNRTPKSPTKKPREFRDKPRHNNLIIFNMLKRYYQHLEDNMNIHKDTLLNDISTNVNNSIVPKEDFEQHIENHSARVDDVCQEEPLHTSDLELVNNKDLDEESFLEEDILSEDEYTFPAVLEESDVAVTEKNLPDINKAINKILSREVKYNEPPAKRRKRNHINQNKEINENDSLALFRGDKKSLNKFNYWISWYSLSNECNHFPFNNVLYENYSPSFHHVMQHCAMVIDCSPMHLYRMVQYIEKMIVDDVKQNISLK